MEKVKLGIQEMFGPELKRMKETKKRYEEGKETKEDLLKYYPNFHMEINNKGKIEELDIVELKYYKKLISIVKKQDKIIDEMSGILAGLAVWDSEKDEPVILGDKEEVKQHFENKVERLD